MKQPDWGMGTKKISQFDWPTGDTSFHGKQISVHTRGEGVTIVFEYLSEADSSLPVDVT